MGNNILDLEYDKINRMTTYPFGPLNIPDASYEANVSARLFDFFDDLTPWPRRLWDSGTVLSLIEVAEASEWSAAMVLSDSSLKWLARDVLALAGKDRGVGDRDLRIQLSKTLEGDLTLNKPGYRRLKELTKFVSDGYLERWLRAASSDKPPSAERLSRAVAAHLLDQGHSMTYLRTWLKSHQGARIEELLRSAIALSEAGEQRFDVLVPFLVIPPLGTNLKSSKEARTASEVSNWLHEKGLIDSTRHNGGFVFRIYARDPWAAVAKAAQSVDRLMARATYARKRNDPVAAGHAWVDGHPAKIALEGNNRGAYVLSLATENRMYEVSARTQLDNALELAAQMNNGAPGPAVSGGWSAIESLLLRPEDSGEGGRGVIAADRAAALVACSWPRAELTALSYKHRPSLPDRLAIELQASASNHERARAVSAAILAGLDLRLSRPSDIAANSRMVDLFAHPKITLRGVERHVTSAMRRFYRHRNLVMHGGAVDVRTLDMCLRTGAPLIGAALDRMTHASLVDSTDPVTLSARAKLNLDLVGGADARKLTDLLE